MPKVKLLLLAFLLAACATNPYKATNRSYRQQVKAYARSLRQTPLTPGTDSVPAPPYWAGTVNFNLRKPNMVIIHHTAQNGCPETLHTFTVTRTQVSAHYVICRDGTIYHMLNDYLRAWQAGVSKWGNITDVNSISIGIELDNNGFEPFPDAQVGSLLRLLATLKTTYHIPAANFIGHGDIAPTRKDDPSAYFPWKTLYDHGFGLWYGDTTGVIVPSGFSPLLGLRLIGYDITDSSAAALAFKRHFMSDTVKSWGDQESKILYMLYRAYQ
ncbi:N-acetylmuramoyl-L-alanine amidase [Dinghuibacter silviterrae]|uniref:N-acetylmuramoyl-L-alanine amidase n=1 Tax=Dinghuibacter silviterrae TaxID=1539049 RepID=A0A4R8DRM8_9BACT|nr:N-acetylmuramoyl-L-alanine amidase [Dinghuibacter silviterrae]TDX00007.1 N-acetylmuramoyl-L-alanine amidase [Dinghuibacter silviterrae]